MPKLTHSPPRFRHVLDWEQRPSGFEHPDVADVSLDSADNVYLLTRRPARVVVYAADGTFLRSFGDGVITDKPHGITVASDGSVYVVDGRAHAVFVFGSDGRLNGTIGSPGQPSQTGMDWSLAAQSWADFRKATNAMFGGAPFNYPTKLAIAPNGELFVTDGYGNARVHRFAADGTFRASWGEPGSGPGQFRLPHGLCITPDERVLVADRENDRIQVFSLDGDFLAQWNEIRRPTAVSFDRDGFIYVAQIASPVGHESWVYGRTTEPIPAAVIVLDSAGRVEFRIGDHGNPCAAGNFLAPHGLAVDSEANLYVAEATYQALATGTYVGDLDNLREQCHTIQKFVRMA